MTQVPELAPKIAPEIMKYPAEFVAFCPDCLTVKNKSRMLTIHDVMDIDSDTAKHLCDDCRINIISELVLPKAIIDELVSILIDIPDEQMPPEFYSDELLYAGRTGADFVMTIDNFLDDTFGDDRDSVLMQIAVDTSSNLPTLVLERKDPKTGEVENELGLLSTIGIVRLFKDNQALYTRLGVDARKAIDAVGEFLLSYDIDARTRLLF